MANGQTLEEFVEDYIKNKERSGEPLSYESWLSKNGVKSKDIYAESIRDINADYNVEKAGYGKSAESLGRAGLTDSGYADYLNASARAKLASRTAGAGEKYAENEAKNYSGYADYLTKHGESESKSYSAAVRSIRAAGIMNYDEAYSYAIASGLSSENAAAAAKTATDIVRSQIKASIMKTIVYKTLNAERAKEYALSLGLSEEEATELSEYAATINEHIEGIYSQDYLDYLKEKAESGSEK